MRIVIRRLWPILLIAALVAEANVASAKAPVLPIPTPRTPPSTLTPHSGVPKTPLMTPNSKGGGAKKRSWFPFGNRNKHAGIAPH